MAGGLRLATVCRPATSNGRYRAICRCASWSAVGIRSCGLGIVLWGLDNGGEPTRIVLHVQQFFDEDAVRTVERVRACGIAVVGYR